MGPATFGPRLWRDRTRSRRNDPTLAADRGAVVDRWFGCRPLFLFCNVFRIPRKPELVWGGLFLIICLVAYLLDAFSPIMLSALIAPVTLVTLIYAIRLPTYHGIFAKRLNPRLDDYLTGKTDVN